MNLDTFNALAEPNRLQIVELLRSGPRPVGEISDRLHMNQPQTSKHLRVLADSGLVSKQTFKQQRIYSLSPRRLKELDTWIEKYRFIWEERFDRLDKLLKKEKPHVASSFTKVSKDKKAMRGKKYVKK